MNIEVINTGTELLLGQVLNTHLRFFSEKLAAKGLAISRQATVPDGKVIGDALRESLERADLILVTGGLGPTTDDVTRDVVTEIVGQKLIYDDEVMKAIELFFSSRKRVMPESNRVQAMIPENGVVMPNAHGTAPGFRLEYVGKWIVCLPGPPRELYPMFIEQVMPWIEQMIPDSKALQMRILRLTGLGESDVQDTIHDRVIVPKQLDIGYCARPGEVDIRLVSSDEQALDETQKQLMSVFQDAVFALKDISLEKVVVDLARKKNKSIVTAESCTGGFVAHRLTNISGASEIFFGSWVTYSNKAKETELGVDPALLEKYGAVSEKVAKAMACGALQKSKADISVALTGIAGPRGGTTEKPVGLVYIACSTREDGGEKVQIIEKRLVQNRERFKLMASQIALDLLRRALI